MGRSSGYCFKIISCGRSSESVDDLDENKCPVKRGWSFRKRSTEIPFENKNSEPVIINYQELVSERIPTNHSPEELTRVSTSTTKGCTESNFVTNVADEDEIEFDYTLDESFVIVIQSAVRKDLAQRELSRRKKIVKFQAAIRGHMVRCRAAGTLRCIQSIVKMQALVRARYANTTFEKMSTKEKVKQDSGTNPHPIYFSIEKLLSNRFAIQLLESTPRTKNISIKCVPSKDDSAWKWLEIWTSVSKQEQVKVNDTKSPIENEVFEQKSDFLSDESKHLKSVFGSRNPAFIAAHSRFEELAFNNTLLTFINSSNSNQEHVPDKSLSVKPVGSPVYESLKLGHSKTGGSECGTELSVTSMLDSPDPSDTECNKELNSFDNTSYDDIVIEPETGRQMYKSPMHEKVKSPETSTTPSNQISNNKKTKKVVPTQKPKQWSNSTKSPITLNLGSGLRNSLDHLPKDPKPANRRKSFGSQSSEPVDQEPRDSCSSNSVPSYMQITESAKAKALAHDSPRSSSDVQSKDAYLKKRRSLHGSPRVKRASQHTNKGSK